MATGDDRAAVVIERLIIVCRLDPVTRTHPAILPSATSSRINGGQSVVQPSADLVLARA
jgi:hypothetical protein